MARKGKDEFHLGNQAESLCVGQDILDGAEGRRLPQMGSRPIAIPKHRIKNRQRFGLGRCWIIS
jgi:hypothetical protein